MAYKQNAKATAVASRTSNGKHLTWYKTKNSRGDTVDFEKETKRKKRLILNRRKKSGGSSGG